MRLLRTPDFVDCSVWMTLERKMAVEPSIMGSRTTAENLERVYRAGRAVLLWDDGGPVGFVAAWDTPTDDLEIGAAWVDPVRRGRGLGNQLVEEMVALVSRTEERAFAITTNPRSVAAAIRAGMQFHDDWTDPIPWKATCGPCDFVSDLEKPTCPKRNTSCRLLLCPGST